jgi:hypothetical protein
VTATSNDSGLEAALAGLLERLSAAQQELLSLLSTKRELIVARDHAALRALAVREEELGAELRACHQQRQQLLAQADAEGLPGQSLSELAASLPAPAAASLGGRVADARDRSRLIRHECLAQWVAVQRTVLHLSQLLEIIATGGRSQPTYGMAPSAQRGGSLIDQAV